MLLLSLLVLLAPLATYLLILAGIHRRARPTLMSGTTETIGLLAAASGLLLFVVPGMLHTLYGQEMRGVALHARTDTDFDAVWWKYRVLWGGYYLLLIAGTTALLLLRRGTTVVLNVDYEGFRRALIRTVEEMHLDATLREGRVRLVRPDAELEMQLDAFPSLAHLTMRWEGGNAGFRREIERKLAAHLDEDAAALTSLPGTWLLVLGSLLFGMSVFVATLVALRWWWT